MTAETDAGWRVVLGLLKKTDPDLLITIARKMVHHLCEHGIKEAEGLWGPVQFCLPGRPGYPGNKFSLSIQGGQRSRWHTGFRF